MRVIDSAVCALCCPQNEVATCLRRHVGGTSEHFVDMMLSGGVLLSGFARVVCRACARGRTKERACRTQAAISFQGQLNAKQICDAVDAGDALAQELFDEYCGNLANGLASFVNLFQPESIVLGGGLAGYGESCSSRCGGSPSRRPSAVRTEIPRSSVRRSAMTQVWWAQRCWRSK